MAAGRVELVVRVADDELFAQAVTDLFNVHVLRLGVEETGLALKGRERALHVLGRVVGRRKAVERRVAHLDALGRLSGNRGLHQAGGVERAQPQTVGELFFVQP